MKLFKSNFPGGRCNPKRKHLVIEASDVVFLRDHTVLFPPNVLYVPGTVPGTACMANICTDFRGFSRSQGAIALTP